MATATNEGMVVTRDEVLRGGQWSLGMQLMTDQSFFLRVVWNPQERKEQARDGYEANDCYERKDDHLHSH